MSGTITHRMVSLARTVCDEAGNENERKNAAFALARLIAANADAAQPDDTKEQLLGGREVTDRELLQILWMVWERAKQDQDFMAHILVRMSLGEVMG